ncbi:Arginase/deacetylase [Punctularia strigosozonata HHB-11173 SS5]|uniref:Arginase/deacetylase n=1 Tax=Punctularia strigosozonata (strain HHB-11173) TaxID=741275 RepID=UPI0004417748|nr:Arginase/deacetylase [Punctularia strigosozonata HHB-11173 SS5]EIN09162.1 Arginase/deacetylase [Punctularia strigosozonata HHB-11173 SS5]
MADDGQRVVYVVSEELAKISSLLPSNRNRSLLVHSLVKEYGLLATSSAAEAGAGEALPKAKILRPQPASYKDLSAYHSEDYLRYVLDPRRSSGTQEPGRAQVTEDFGLEDDCPLFPGVHRYVSLIAGASLSAAQALRTGQADVAICWDGGRHHAHKSRASGFCYVADVVLAILALKRPLRGPPPPLPGEVATAPAKPMVMYVDLDLHFADGVCEAFASSHGTSGHSQILTLSIHHAAPGFFPASPLADLPVPDESGAADPFTLAVPLRQGLSGATLKEVWMRVVEPIKDAFFVRFVVLQCGVDGLAGDPCGIWNIDLESRSPSMGWCIGRAVHEWGCKTLLLGGGGYSSPNAARAWAYFTSIALGRPLPLDADIPDHSTFPVYAPSFVLDVPAGNMQDRNSLRDLANVEVMFTRVCDILRRRNGNANMR